MIIDGQTMNEVHPGDLALFYDDRFPPDPNDDPLATPINRVAVVVDEGGALYLGKRGWVRTVQHVPMARFSALRNLELRRFSQPEFGSQIAVYFRIYKNNPNYFEAGLKALHAGNMQPFVEGRLFPMRPFYPDEDTYNKRWEAFVNSLKPGDAVYTVDTESNISRFIAWATHGTWSHVAWYTGNGIIWESTTKGIRNISIDVYKHRRFFLGGYRHIDLMNTTLWSEDANRKASNHNFRENSYNYFGAIKYGLKSFVGDHSHNLVPNSAIFQGNLVRIALV
jgi:hypothetical protein